MKCPLLIAAEITHGKTLEDSAVVCGKEECAWWDDDNKRCCIVTIASKLAYIHSALQDIRDKMPTYESFVK